MRHLLADGTTFDDAYRQLAPRARIVASRVLRDEAAAEDVVQEVFEGLWRRPASYDPGRGSLSSYLMMVTRSRAVDRLRTRNAVAAAIDRSGRAEASTATAAQDSAADVVLLRERRRQVLHALEHLPPDQREALLLAYGLGLSTREVAEVVRVPAGTAKSRVRLGLSKARVALADAA